jgi:hypothetical protein
MNFGIWGKILMSVKKIKALLKSEKKTGTLHEDLGTFLIISHSVSS